MKKNKYGILLLQDDVYSYPKDQIRLEDRILEHYDDLRSVRLSSIRGKDTNDLLQKIRCSHDFISMWSKSFNTDIPKYVYVMVGMDELKGGASHKWNQIHLEALILELSVYDFEIILCTPNIKRTGLRENQSYWLQDYKKRVRKLSIKYNLETIVLHKETVGMNRLSIENIAKKIAKYTKKIYAERTIGETKIKQSEDRLANVEVIEIKSRKKKSVTGITRPRRKHPKSSTIKETVKEEVVEVEPVQEISACIPLQPSKKGRKINNIGTTIKIDSDKKNLASY